MLTPTSTIRRVVSCFLLTSTSDDQDLSVAVFHRQATMPTFPSHWAGISGSIEPGETPWEAARRELFEETNLEDIIMSSCSDEVSLPDRQHGLYVDVPYHRRKQTKSSQHHDDFQTDSTIIIRVYPFVIHLTPKVAQQVEFRGTEHDAMQWISIPRLEKLDPTVPALATAFHHATCGRYCTTLPRAAHDWANDRVSGAATMAQNALQLVARGAAQPSQLIMLRPSMVAITNVLQQIEAKNDNIQAACAAVLEKLEREASRAIDLAVERVLARIQDKGGNESFTIAVYSRSSTLRSILQRVQKESKRDVSIICSKSTPGDEGILMAQDLGDASCVSDDELIQKVSKGEIDLILVGCDCVMDDIVVNKVGTAALARTGKENSCPVLCCSDRWKIWSDEFPPPLEPIFESIPRSYFDEILVPGPEE